MNSPFYTLSKNRQPICVNSILDVGDTERFRVGHTNIFGATISTVFLGIDHRFDFSKKSLPILWETMIFKGLFNQLQWRYSSEADAKAGHRKAVALVLSTPFVVIYRWWKNLS